MKFSVLISVYFKEKPEYLDRALKSIICDQTLKPNEIVLVKDGILNQKLDFIINKYLNKYSNLFKVISLDKNQGLANALNIGLDNCKYEVIARMDSDDISHPKRFEEQINLLKKNPSLDLIGSWIEEFKEERGIIKRRCIRKVEENQNEIYLKLKFSSPFNHPSVIYKKSRVKQVGGYSSEFIIEDYYLWIRMALGGCKFYNIQKSLVFFRVTKDTFKRRGGYQLYLNDIKLQTKLYKLNFINNYEFVRNLFLMAIYRLIPSKIRDYLQIVFFRDKI